MQYMKAATTIAALVAIAASTPVAAQGRRNSDHIPPGQRPPAGMCRIWIDGVPPGQQPAPTDCATAAARRPNNSRIIYSDQSGNRSGNRNADQSRNRGVYQQDGSIFLPNSRRTGTNQSNQNCFQQLDRNGQMRTICRDRDGDDDEDDDNGRVRADRRDDDHGHARKAHKNHKGHGDRDRDDQDD